MRRRDWRRFRFVPCQSQTRWRSIDERLHISLLLRNMVVLILAHRDTWLDHLVIFFCSTRIGTNYCRMYDLTTGSRGDLQLVEGIAFEVIDTDFWLPRSILRQFRYRTRWTGHTYNSNQSSKQISLTFL